MTDKSKSSSSSGKANGSAETPTSMMGKAIGVAAIVVAGAVAVTAVRKKMGSDEEQSIFHLRQIDEGWALEIEGSDAPKAVFDNKDEGLAAARELAHQSAPCELVIYRTDGSEQDRHSYTG